MTKRPRATNEMMLPLHNLSLLNTDVIDLNIHAIPLILVGLVLFGVGVMVLIREGASSLGRWFFAFASAMGLYCVGAGVSYTLKIAALALDWERTALMGVALIPGTFFIVTTRIIGQERHLRSLSAAAMSISLCFALLARFSSLMIMGTVSLDWGFYPHYGIAGYLYIAYFAVTITSCYLLYIREYRRSRTLLHRRRLLGIIIACGIGYIGAVDFLPAIGITVFAFGYIPIFFYVVLIAVVILRYRLVDITPELAAAQILKTMRSAVIVADLEGVVRVANDVALGLFGSRGRELLENPLDGLADAPGERRGESRDYVPFKDVEFALPGEGGNQVILSVSSSSLEDPPGIRVGTVYVAHDISDRKSSAQRMERIAMHDALTGLPNRLLLFDRMRQELSRADRSKKQVGILFMDLDRFKEVNDRHGHAVGDELLVQVASRLVGCVRKSDTISRVGGDEFIALCGDLDSREGADKVALTIEEALSAPFRLGGTAVCIGVSIGVGIYPSDGADADTLLSVADAAMYRAKQAGRKA